MSSSLSFARLGQTDSVSTNAEDFVFMGATSFSYVFRSLGGEEIIIHGIEALGFGSWGILIVLMVTIFCK